MGIALGNYFGSDFGSFLFILILCWTKNLINFDFGRLIPKLFDSGFVLNLETDFDFVLHQ